eukprot:CAMPEP_0204359088 /NCGR_PEP_ID=MMETSP0469-20131031/36997_1 /ASSEMBLY_ACC=CAM_ASM_000384 /TAXON_ID=2969 /ORGANISM="Oxyrrhis marina" /LENGTH=350 /DNA_ID=CAMNT_0051347059 /DNA_START=1 /DNA_END=1053 /DNA_ORIENTATION=+
MGADLYSIFFAAVRGMSQTQLLTLLGAVLARMQIIKAAGSKEIGAMTAKLLLPCFVFAEFTKPAAKEKLKVAFTSAEGPLLLGLSVAQMLLCLILGGVVVRLFSSCKGMQRSGNLINLSVAFGNATALPIILLKTVEHFFPAEDRDFVTLCVLVYGTINRALMWTVGCAICSGKAKFSLLINEINIASALGLFVAFSGDLIGFDLLELYHSKSNPLDFAGTIDKVGMLANPLLLMVAGSSLSKGPKSEDLDAVSIAASSVARLILCVPISFCLLYFSGVLAMTSGSARVLGFVLMVESCMPAAAQLALVAAEGGDASALQNMSSLLFYHSLAAPVTCTIVLGVALQTFTA